MAPPFLAHFLVPDEQLTDVLLGQSGLDRRLAGCCRLERPPAADADLTRRAGWRDGRRPVRLHSQGPAGSPRSRHAHDLAAGLGLALLTLDPPGSRTTTPTRRRT
ncbi:hypothetical protein [Streptomyces bobili]|uniref:hypothetical protein n=1 Tax=Streptomyces bobili TaxID=67280 RepID=UPI00379D702D